MDEYLEDNLKHWEEVAVDNAKTNASEDIEKFLNGKTSLMQIEREGLDDVAGKKLLHLQSHLGLNTLSWAREGAEVTGVDFSAEAVETARELSGKAGLDNHTRFIEKDVFELPDVHDERYDIVVTTHGSLWWLPNIEKWAKIVSEFLKPGGILYLVEIHPLAVMLPYDFDGDRKNIEFEYPYFTPEKPVTMEEGSDGSGSYDSHQQLDHERTHSWSHSLGEILTSIINANVELKFVREYPFTSFEQFSGMVEDENNQWWFKDEEEIPLTVLVKGVKKTNVE